MPDNKLIIKELDYNNIEDRKAASIMHAKLLKDSYLSMLGYDFLVDYYYNLLIKNEIINCLLCVNNNKYIGFAGFTKFPFSFMTMGLKKNFFTFLIFFIKKMLTKPKIIIVVFKIITESIIRKFSKKSTKSLSEFLSLGVLSEHSDEKDVSTGLSASRLLITSVIDKCKNNGLNDMRMVIKKKNIKSLSVFKTFGGKIVNDNFTDDSVELMLYF